MSREEEAAAIRETTDKILGFIKGFVNDHDTAEQIWHEDIPDMLGEAFSDATRIMVEANQDQIVIYPRSLTYALMTASFHLGYISREAHSTAQALGEAFVADLTVGGSTRTHRPRGRRGRR